MSNENIGTLQRLCLDTALPFDSGSLWLPFLSESMTKNEELRFIPGVTGTRAHLRGQYRIGPQAPAGQIRFGADRLILDNWLRCVLGADEDSNTFNVDDLLPEVYVGIEKGTGFYTYSGVKVNVGEFARGGQDFLELNLDLHAETETFNDAFAWPITARTFEQPYQFHDTGGSMTFAGASRGIADWRCRVDNQLVTGDLNGLTRDGTLRAQDRAVSGRVVLRPLPANSDTVNTGLTPQNASIVFTHAEVGGNVLTFLLYNVMFPGQPPQVSGRQVYGYPIDFMACADDDFITNPAANPDIRITNVHS